MRYHDLYTDLVAEHRANPSWLPEFDRLWDLLGLYPTDLPDQRFSHNGNSGKLPKEVLSGAPKPDPAGAGRHDDPFKAPLFAMTAAISSAISMMP